jgi:hypothetical protein
MRLLRSEDEVDGGSGVLLGIEELQQLARAWYGDRLDPDWRPRSRGDSQRLLADLGLDGAFWELPGSAR